MSAETDQLRRELHWLRYLSVQSYDICIAMVETIEKRELDYRELIDVALGCNRCPGILLTKAQERQRP